MEIDSLERENAWAVSEPPRDEDNGLLGIVRAVQVGLVFWGGVALLIWAW